MEHELDAQQKAFIKAKVEGNKGLMKFLFKLARSPRVLSRELPKVFNVLCPTCRRITMKNKGMVIMESYCGPCRQKVTEALKELKERLGY